MNTVRHRQRLGIKRSILTALLMGFCCLFYTPEAFSQEESSAPPKRSAAMEAEWKKSEDYADRQYDAQTRSKYFGGASTLRQYAVGVAQMENDIAKAEAKGDMSRANYLRKQHAFYADVNQSHVNSTQQKANAGDTRAQRELDEYYAFMKTVEGSSSAGSFPFLISIISGLLLYGYIVLLSPKDARINRKTLIPWCVGLAIFDMLGNWVNQSWLFLFVEILVILVVARNFQCSWKRSFTILGLMLVSILILGGLLPLFF